MTAAIEAATLDREPYYQEIEGSKENKLLEERQKIGANPKTTPALVATALSTFKSLQRYGKVCPITTKSKDER